MAHDHPTPALSPNYEKSDANLPALLKFIVALFVSLAAVFALMVGFMYAGHAFVGQETVDRSPQAVDVILPPTPHLEALKGSHLSIPSPEDPTVRLEPFTTRMWAAIAAENRARLESYGWVDKQTEVVHIPIAAAKELALQRNLFATKK